MEELEAPVIKDEFEKTCIAGGHPNHFHLLPEMGDLVLEKETKIQEIESYENIFSNNPSDPKYEENQRLQKFLPCYYGSIIDKERQHIYIKLENLLHNRQHANVLDFRMGTSSITINTPLDKYEYINKKD